MPERAPHDAERLARIHRRFSEFAAEYADLSLYATICRHVAGDDDLASLLLAARPGQARPVLWLAALHELVLRRPDTAAAQWYPSVVGANRVPSGDPWPDVRRTVVEHRDELVERISTRGTQTNEVNRAVYLALGLAATASDTGDRPLALVELGASAGLLLAVDRYAVRLDSPSGAVVLGDADSPVRCAGDDRAGAAAELAARRLPPVRGRAGVDLHPVELSDDDAVRWLEACLWPEVPGRVERFRAARDLLRDEQPTILRGDMVDDLRRAVEVARAQTGTGRGTHVVVFSSWALTYLDPARRVDLEAEVRTLAGECDAVSWLTAEPPACAPGIEPPGGIDDVNTVVGLRRWRAGREREPLTLGTCHPHGAWVDLSFEGLDGQTS